jgi:sensor c-di-GMP phosphodiesterase-like protein
VARERVLKLDKRLVDSIGVNGGNSSLQKLASLISANGRTVAAEGVERPEQADFLRQVGLQMAQGWLYSKPLRAPEFVAWHAAHR